MKNRRVSRGKEIIKIRAEINGKETKETIAKIIKSKSWFWRAVLRCRRNRMGRPLSPSTNSSKEHLNTEQIPQNNF